MNKDEILDLNKLREDLEKQLFDLWRENHNKFQEYIRKVENFFDSDLKSCVYWHETLKEALENPKHEMRKTLDVKEIYKSLKKELRLFLKGILKFQRKEVRTS